MNKPQEFGSQVHETAGFVNLSCKAERIENLILRYQFEHYSTGL